MKTRWKVKSKSGISRASEIGNNVLGQHPMFEYEERRHETLLTSFEAIKDDGAGMKFTIGTNTGKRMQRYTAHLGKTEVEMLIAFLQQQLPNCRDYHYDEVVVENAEKPTEEKTEGESTAIPSETFMTLRHWKETNQKEGYSVCSKNIHPSGYVRFTSVSRDWWINCPDANGGNGQSFSSHPNEIVYLANPNA